MRSPRRAEVVDQQARELANLIAEQLDIKLPSPRANRRSERVLPSSIDFDSTSLACSREDAATLLSQPQTLDLDAARAR